MISVLPFCFLARGAEEEAEKDEAEEEEELAEDRVAVSVSALLPGITVFPGKDSRKRCPLGEERKGAEV
jgi:hypothetical protein